MSERDKAMRRVQICCFAMLDASLYLDSHPDDRAALEYYNKYKRLCEKAVSEFEANYGPLTQTSAANGMNGSWEWVETPWPWES